MSPANQPPSADSSWRSDFLIRRGTTPRYARSPISCCFSASSTHCADAREGLPSTTTAHSSSANTRVGEATDQQVVPPDIIEGTLSAKPRRAARERPADCPSNARDSAQISRGKTRSTTRSHSTRASLTSDRCPAAFSFFSRYSPCSRRAPRRLSPSPRSRLRTHALRS